MSKDFSVRSLATFLLLTTFACGSGESEFVKLGEECGGDSGVSCGPGLFCEYPEGSCGKDTARGGCKEVPEICAQVYSPVCGCDGKTYSNECMARSAGVSIKSKGECGK